MKARRGSQDCNAQHQAQSGQPTRRRGAGRAACARTIASGPVRPAGSCGRLSGRPGPAVQEPANPDGPHRRCGPDRTCADADAGSQRCIPLMASGGDAGYGRGARRLQRHAASIAYNTLRRGTACRLLPFAVDLPPSPGLSNVSAVRSIQHLKSRDRPLHAAAAAACSSARSGSSAGAGMPLYRQRQPPRCLCVWQGEAGS